MPIDWDKLRVFHAAAHAGSFTHAGDGLNLSQSAVSRQVSALEQELDVTLFHRHARGLKLTEQGELLYQTTQELISKLEMTRAHLTDSRERVNGDLIVTTTVGLGTAWLTPRLGEFMDQYPDIKIRLILADDELDLGMREADVAIRMRRPTQSDLIQRKLFTVHFHLCASRGYINKHGQPKTVADLDSHRLIAFGGPIPTYLQDINWTLTAGREGKGPREPVFLGNSLMVMRRCVEQGIGIAVLPDYLMQSETSIVQLMTDQEMPSLDAYFVYAEELRNVARVNAFRDFLLSKAQRWSF